MILDDLNRWLPQGWQVTHLIHLDPGWQVNVKDDEFVVVATGTAIEEALTAAEAKILACDYAGSFNIIGLIHRKEKAKVGDLFSALGFKRSVPIVARRI